MRRKEDAQRTAGIRSDRLRYSHGHLEVASTAGAGPGDVRRNLACAAIDLPQLGGIVLLENYRRVIIAVVVTV
jgi:hypothetical protein